MYRQELEINSLALNEDLQYKFNQIFLSSYGSTMCTIFHYAVILFLYPNAA